VKKLLIPLVIVLVCVFVITGCGSDTTTTKPAATTAAVTTTAAPATTPAGTKPAATTAASTTAATTTAPASSVPVTSAATPASGKLKGGLLRIISASTPGTPIGWMQETLGASTVTMQLCLDFLLHERMDGTLDPNIAESWDLDPKVPSVVFHIRKGVKYADGSDLTAQTVKWDLETNAKGPQNSGQAAFWKSFEAIDDYTLKVTFTTWQNRLLRGFADASTYLYSKEAYDKNGLDWIRWHMVGPGAFKQVDFQRDVITKTVRNEYYWEKGKPYLDGCDMLYVTDELTRVALFKSGGAELLDLVGSGRVASELKTAGYQIISKQSGITILVPDSVNDDSPWSNPKVRQAAEYAIDKESIAKTFGYGYWQAAYQWPSPSSKAWNPKFAGRAYDIAKAKQLLAEAGYPGGFKTKIIVQTGGSGDIPVTLQAYLSKVGIQAEIEYQDAAKYTATMTGSWKNGLLYNSLIEWPNPNQAFNFYMGATAPNFKVMKKPAGWTDAFTATMTSPTQEIPLIQKVVNLLYDDTTFIPLYYGASMYAGQNNVRDTGLDQRSSIYWNQAEAWLSK
jgi:peptide/nickel transport system substrate-binding protein